MSNLQGADTYELAGDISDLLLPSAPNGDDVFEPNDVAPVAERIHLDGWTVSGRQRDEDYFVLNLAEPTELSVELAFAHREGDIDVQLLDENLNVLAAEISVTDNEILEHDAAAGTFFIRVFGGDVGSDYTLSVAQANEIRFTHHNDAFPVDVTNDGIVTPRDALLVINHLATHGGGRLPDLTEQPDAYVDVNDDGLVSPLDALRVINSLEDRSVAAASSSSSVELPSPFASSLEEEESQAERVDIIDQIFAVVS